MFAYCLNNPVVYSDDGGEAPHIAIVAAIGALVGGFSAYMAGESVLVGAIGGAAVGAGIAFWGGNLILSACTAGAANIVSQAANHYIENSNDGRKSFYDTMGNFELDYSSLAVDVAATTFFTGVGNLTGNVLDDAFKGLTTSIDKNIHGLVSHCFDGINTLLEFSISEAAQRIFTGG